ncbi:DUF2029 domain-containing protein [Nocardia brasiliensis]|uniref:DUF2029 domain-containing protein n=1 Tax=Nocardia brasiliensis TaxID=37326 RepID=A0A6G9XR54_NOCBR|nr:glycosyltransferase 87 family protein [Nocardia brasiliensis]QIS03330.1 DUF2029 domain-containing protein [Nocardia brasiliensis]
MQRGAHADNGVGTVALTLSAVAAVAVLVWHVFALPIQNGYYGLFGNNVDLWVYRAGGTALLDGHGLYTGPVFFEMEFTYTPFAALVFVPLTVMSFGVTEIVWWLAIFAAVAGIVWCCLRILGYANTRRTWAFTALLAVVCTAFEPVRTTIWLGQINVFLVLLVLWDLTRARSAMRGIGVGIAAGIKLTPGFFLVYLACTRQWRTWRVAAATLAATVAAGALVRPADSWSYWGQQITRSGRVGLVDSPANQSVNGFLAQLLRFYDVQRFSTPIGNTTVYQPPLWLWLAVTGSVAALGMAAAVVAFQRHNELLAITLTGMTSACVSPFSWGHHWVWLVPLFVLTLHHARAARTKWRFLPVVAVSIPSFCWWWNYWGGPAQLEAPHPIGIGFFMLPRDVPEWWIHLLVPLYAGCYPLILVTAATCVLATARAAAPSHPRSEPRLRPSPLDTPATPATATTENSSAPTSVRC